MTFQKILVAADDSAFAAHAASIGVELATRLRAKIAFVNVIDSYAALVGGDSGTSAAESVALAEGEAKSMLAAFRQRASATPAALEFLAFGQPAAQIVHTARTWPADLIVIGSHSRGAVQKLLLDSVAEAALRHAHCPVLVVRAPA
jgi:nucleotide-binding universal stress UspA family protein